MSFRENSEVIQMVNIFLVFKEFECLTPSSQNRVTKLYPLPAQSNSHLTTTYVFEYLRLTSLNVSKPNSYVHFMLSFIKSAVPI
jgi:hypothetical protein